MAAEEYSERLNPGEVSFHVVVSFSDEMGVDVEVGFGDYAEILVFLAMEVKSDSIAPDESRVLAYCTRPVAVCSSIHKHVIKLVYA